MLLICGNAICVGLRGTYGRPSLQAVSLSIQSVFVCPIVLDADYFRAVDDVVDNRIGDGLSSSIACQPGGLR